MIEINKKKLCESCFAETDSEVCPKCGFNKSDYTADPLVLPMGTKLDDKIVIGRVMGKGGFGVTYLGYDLRMDKTIAVKEYYPNGIAYRSPSGTEVSVADTKSVETFEKGAEKFYTEAEMVAQFNGNPNIVSVYDYFRANNTVYLIMEYLSGITLKNYVKKHGRLTDGQALFVIDKIAAALSITHSAGVLHRDISPDNIMICMDGKIKLIDFGAARQIMAESSSNLTVVMKPGYTPIEQYTKKGRQGAWTDIYSLGVSVYYALTEVIIDDPYARMDDDSELAENRHGINNDLWTILKKCTMINASDRYGSAIDLRKALKSVSAPIKSEPIGLSDDDLKSDDNSNAPEEPAEITAEKECPVTMAAPVSEAPETIEVFEDETAAPDASSVSSPVSSKKAEVVGNNADKGKSKNKKFIIGGICTAAVIVIGIIGIIIAGSSPNDIAVDNGSVTESVTDGTSGTVKETEKKESETTAKSSPEASDEMNKTVELDNHDMVWGLTKSISKSVLKGFDGDIRVTLKTKYMDVQRNEDGNYYHCIRILSDGGKDLTVNAVSLTKDEYNNFPVGEDGMDFVFIIPKFFAENVKDKVYFELENVMIDSVALEADSYDKVIEFDDKYAGDWQLDGFIPKSELESFNGDVRICVTLDAKILGEIDDPYYHVMPKTAFYEEISVSVTNLVLVNKDDIYEFYGEGEKQFVFEISQEEIAKLPEEGLSFQVHNVLLKSAALKGLSEKDGTSAEAVTETTPTVTEPEVTTAIAAELEKNEKPLYIPLSTKYPEEGNAFDQVNTLRKNYLKYFTGDIKVVLDIECVYEDKDDDGNYYHALSIIDGSWHTINVSAPNTGRDYWDCYGVDENQKKFTFIVKRADIDNSHNELLFVVHNVIVKGATVYDYDPDEDKINPNAKIIQLDNKYPGLYQYSTPIPKKELEGFNGDVKVTLSIERFNDNTDDFSVNGKKMYWVSIMPYSGDEPVFTKADNVTLWKGFSFELRYIDVPDKFTFVIPESEVPKLSDDGLVFKCRNVIIKSAALEKA